jgi:hypothetical protein
MYAAYEPVTDVSVRVWNREELRRGFRITMQDGSTGYVTYKLLNIPRTKFIRLYYERMYGVPPPKDVRSHFALSPMNQRLRELTGSIAARPGLWDWRILVALNKSLHREPGRPDFIVKVEAPALERRFSISDLNDGSGVTPVEQQTTATALWKAEWSDGWVDEHR